MWSSEVCICFCPCKPKPTCLGRCTLRRQLHLDFTYTKASWAKLLLHWHPLHTIKFIPDPEILCPYLMSSIQLISKCQILEKKNPYGLWRTSRRAATSGLKPLRFNAPRKFHFWSGSWVQLLIRSSIGGRRGSLLWLIIVFFFPTYGKLLKWFCNGWGVVLVVESEFL